jgi:RHS repeat-associated protein
LLGWIFLTSLTLGAWPEVGTLYPPQDSLGRLVRTRRDNSITGVVTETLVSYFDTQSTRLERDARGFNTTYVLDGQERVVKITDPLGKTQTFTYDGVNKRSETDKRGFTTQFDYDGINRLVRVTDPLGQALVTNYRDAQRQVVETDKRGLVKTTQLDALGRTVSVTRSGVVLEQHEYDGVNNRIRSLDANGNVTRFVYDGANRLTARTEGFGTPEAATTEFTYDQVGNLLTEKDARVTGKDFDVKNTYDELNRLVSVEDGESNITGYEYDGEGNRTAQVEPEGNRTEYDYGELNELIEVRMADQGVFSYRYDPNRNRVEQLDGNGNKVSFTYDSLNRLTQMFQDPDGLRLATTHEYDANGNEIRLTDAKAQQTTFEYDKLNRMTAKVYGLTPADLALFTRTHRIDYGYDPSNNLIRVDETRSSGNDPPAVFSNLKTYDNLDRLKTETDSFGRALQYGYDPQGNRTSLIDPDGKQTIYTYDALSRLKTLVTDGGTTTYAYFPDGLKQSVANPNGTTSSFSYDAADRLTSIEHKKDADVISSYVYEYSRNGNRAKQTEMNAGRTEETTYTYDPVNRLRSVAYPDRIVAYEYDKAGNRTRELTTGAEASDKRFTYDPVNRLTLITDPAGAELARYTSDPNGNTTSKVAGGVETRFLFDIRNQLSEVQTWQGGVQAATLGRYGYDYDGRRIFKIGAEGVRRYTYDQRSVITEADQAGVTVSKYDYGLDQLVRLSNRGEGKSFFHLDALGSTVNLTTDAGAARESIFYNAWGQERDRVGASANHFTFTGHEIDRETGLFYAKARFYDPESGRFLSQDPLFGDINEPPSLHRFSYANSNPLFFIDPTGEQSIRQWFGLDRDPAEDAQNGWWSNFGKSLGLNFTYGLWNVATFGFLGRHDPAIEAYYSGQITEQQYYQLRANATVTSAVEGAVVLGGAYALGRAGFAVAGAGLEAAGATGLETSSLLVRGAVSGAFASGGALLGSDVVRMAAGEQEGLSSPEEYAQAVALGAGLGAVTGALAPYTSEIRTARLREQVTRNVSVRPDQG